MPIGKQQSSIREIAAPSDPVLARSAAFDAGDPDIPRMGLVVLAVLALATLSRYAATACSAQLTARYSMTPGWGALVRHKAMS
jgi:hypothetical protein